MEKSDVTADLESYQYRGARALILMHERSLRDFLACWQRAKSADLELPATDDPAYQSLEALLHHVLRAAAGYMMWLCESLALSDPGFRPVPAIEAIAAEAEDHVAHLLAGWRVPLASLTEEDAYGVERASGWGAGYCLDAMLEHAAIHPMRHQFQLEELLEQAASA